MKAKVIDEYNDGWKTQVGGDGQIALVQGDQDEEEEFLDLDDDEELLDDPDLVEDRHGRRYWNGGRKQKCIVCGDEFETQRSHARFCSKPGCRQKFNRQERALQAARAQIDQAILRLVDLREDEHFGKAARELLFSLEDSLIKKLDDIAPDRHGKHEITARPVRLHADELAIGDVVYAIIDESSPMALKVRSEPGDSFVACELAGRHYNEIYMVPRSAIWLRLVEPGEGGHDDPH